MIRATTFFAILVLCTSLPVEDADNLEDNLIDTGRDHCAAAGLGPHKSSACKTAFQKGSCCYSAVFGDDKCQSGHIKIRIGKTGCPWTKPQAFRCCGPATATPVMPSTGAPKVPPATSVPSDPPTESEATDKAEAEAECKKAHTICFEEGWLEGKTMRQCSDEYRACLDKGMWEGGEPTGSGGTAPTSEPFEVTMTISETTTDEPTDAPTAEPTADPTAEPSAEPTGPPTDEPTADPTLEPTLEPTATPTEEPTAEPTATPTEFPTTQPPTTDKPSFAPSHTPTELPTAQPTASPTDKPSHSPTNHPTRYPSRSPTHFPTRAPTRSPTRYPTRTPTRHPCTVTVYPHHQHLSTHGYNAWGWSRARFTGIRYSNCRLVLLEDNDSWGRQDVRLRGSGYWYSSWDLRNDVKAIRLWGSGREEEEELTDAQLKE